MGRSHAPGGKIPCSVWEGPIFCKGRYWGHPSSWTSQFHNSFFEDQLRRVDHPDVLTGSIILHNLSWIVAKHQFGDPVDMSECRAVLCPLQ